MYLRLLITAICLLVSANFAAAQPFAYVANSGTNTVSVIDTADYSVQTLSLAPSLYPWAVTVGRSGQYAYVSSQESKDVKVIDTATRTIVKSISTAPYKPSGLAVNPAETRLYVTNNDSNSLSVIDITGVPSELARVTLDSSVTISNPEGVAVNAAGDKVYVSNTATGKIAVITVDETQVPPAGYTKTDEISVGAEVYPYGVVLNAAGTKLYVANMTGSVAVVDLANGNAVTTLPLNGNGSVSLALNDAASRLYAPIYSANNSNINLIDTAASAILPAKYSSGGATWGIGITPDGSKLILTQKLDDKVIVLNAADGALLQTINLAAGAQPISMGNFVGPALPYTITATAQANCSITPAGAVLVNNGGRTFAMAATTGGYSVSDVKIDNVSVGAPTSYAFTNVTAGHTIEAICSNAAVSELTVTLTNAGGTVSSSPVGVPANGGSANFTTGQGVAITAYPDATHIVGSWGGACSGSGTTCNVTMDAAKSVTLTFAPKPLTGPVKVVETGLYYDSIYLACTAPATPANATLLVIGALAPESTTSNYSRGLMTLKGGYADTTFLTKSGTTRLTSLTIGDTGFIVDGIVIQ